MTGSSNGHLYSLDMMKFVAAIFITNPHFQPLYEGVNTAFATFVKINNDRLARKIKSLLNSLLLKRERSSWKTIKRRYEVNL